MFQPLKSLLHKKTAVANWQEPIEAYQALTLFHAVVREIGGEVLANNIQPVSYKKPTITVACLSPVAAHELTLKRHLIFERIALQQNSNVDGTPFVISKIQFLF